MAVIAVTFRIDSETTALGDPSSRWTSVDKAVKSGTKSITWNEATAFYLIQSDLTPLALAESVVASSKLDIRADMIACISMSDKSYAVLGEHDRKGFDALIKLL